MQKKDMIEAVIERIGNESNLTRQDVRKVLDAATEVIAEALANGERVTLPGFGTFEVRDRAERSGLHPQTREPITIPARKTPYWSASPSLKTAVRDANGGIHQQS
ncbi:MAG: HU family DNA-binding protein [Chloroflexaceae bacterium]|nr:HU family DNA-binding protein [Chloroflexaceae bacterium]